jgi:hypothetical protein
MAASPLPPHSLPTSVIAQIPQEVLEHIAFFAAADPFLGPPSGIFPLLVLNRAFHNALSLSTNPFLYARIFAHKYDVGPALRRMGSDALTAAAMAEELQRRSVALKRFRHHHDWRDSNRAGAGAPVTDLLWVAYLMLLESDGKNEQQLREYAHLNHWLRDYWFDPAGASRAVQIIQHTNTWPENSERMSLALWLFWFLLRPGQFFCGFSPHVFLTWEKMGPYR